MNVEKGKKSKLKWVSDFLAEHSSWSSRDYEGRANQLAQEYYTKIFGKQFKKDRGK